jgi:hypothetical protein
VRVSRFLPSVPCCFFVRNLEGLPLRLAVSRQPPRVRGAARLTRDSDSAAVEACWYMPPTETQYLLFESEFMLLYPRGYEMELPELLFVPHGYDMTSNKTYSYPFSVCRNL